MRNSTSSGTTIIWAPCSPWITREQSLSFLKYVQAGVHAHKKNKKNKKLIIWINTKQNGKTKSEWMQMRKYNPGHVYKL